ncbi:MAG: polyribonucleotide nucleotidyltransferase [Thermales bacterium]|nr:polyribonucleotide nucleotidyltransferase [Thermales bacterium]
MFKDVSKRHEINYHGQKLILETGLLAQQATSSVLATIGETTVLAVVQVGKENNSDYFPLQVMYEERMYASGKIKGSRFMKREGRPSDNAVLTGRMVDRSLRSLFDPYIRNEIQVIITVLSIDEVNPPDMLSVLAASTAVNMSNIAGFVGPVSSVRIALDGKLIVNPSYSQIAISEAKVVLSGDGSNIMMVEAEANNLGEDQLNKAIDLANTELKILTQFQKEFLHMVDSKVEVEIVSVKPRKEVVDFWRTQKTLFEEVVFSAEDKQTKLEARNKIKEEALNIVEVLLAVNKRGRFENFLTFKDWFATQNNNDVEVFVSDENSIVINREITLALLELVNSFEMLSNLKSELENGYDVYITEIIKENVLVNKRRVDGRKLDETRRITCQVGVLGRTHGSSLFQRGETQVLNVLTIGTNRDAQLLDDMEDFEEVTKNYIHHYNFPPYSVGETGRYSGPGRREIGHGALAEKAMLPVLPDFAKFPYTLRLVSECLGSNGSTSMASVCGSSLSLMDAGVPISETVAGVAMGLVLDNSGEFEVLTDIQGLEDHHGDMDFKVTGTTGGITAIQLDNKVAGLTPRILKVALDRAKEARLHILSIMNEAIDKPRKNLNKYAPSVQMINIPMEKVSEVIGPSGKVIKNIIAKTGTEIEIEDETGRALIYGNDHEKSLEALKMIEQIIKEYKTGDVVNAQIFRLEAYGAFVKIDASEKKD